MTAVAVAVAAAGLGSGAAAAAVARQQWRQHGGSGGSWPRQQWQRCSEGGVVAAVATAWGQCGTSSSLAVVVVVKRDPPKSDKDSKNLESSHNFNIISEHNVLIRLHYGVSFRFSVLAST